MSVMMFTFLLSLSSGFSEYARDEVLAPPVAGRGIDAFFHVAPVSDDLLVKIKRTTWHPGCPVSPDDLRQVTVAFWSFHNVPSVGTLVVNKAVAAEIAGIFQKMFQHGFLIDKIRPVEEYGGSDDASMLDDNTSAFNCRENTSSPGTFSIHSWGTAIDINPMINPYVKGDTVLPAGASKYLDRNLAFPGSILDHGFEVEIFAKKGWTWGGHFVQLKDYQHFEKAITVH